MTKNSNILLYSLWILGFSLLLQQLQYIFHVVEARTYVDTYSGDIDTKNNDIPYQRRYPQQQQQQQQQSYGQNYANDYQQQTGRQQQSYGRQQYAPTNNINNNPKNANRGNRWQTAANLREDAAVGQYGPEYRNQTMYKYSTNKSNKCDIWIPEEAMDKYPTAVILQMDTARKLRNIQVCCPGYGPMYDNTQCRPLCENCRNGVCIAPDVCQCYDEFVSNDNGDCVFTCPMGCLNGRCYLDGSCECDPGYKLDETRKFCRPICSKGCGTSPLLNCTEPEVCGCIKGYILTDSGCQPVCQPDCGIGGTCRKPDCGYDGTRNAGNDVTVCDKPNVCECLPGYTLKDGVCQSDCYQKCDNGICYSRNRCICNPGYVYHERATQCIPK